MSNYGDDWRDTEFGAGQERYYGGLGEQPGPAPAAPAEPARPGGGGREGGGRKGVLIGIAAVLAVALAGGGAYLATQMGGDEPDQAQGSSGGAQASGAGSGSAAPQPTASVQVSRSETPYEPSVSGWRVQASEDAPVIFDVPPASETFKNVDGDTEPAWTFQGDRGYGYPHPKNPFGGAFTKPSALFRLNHCAAKPNTTLAFLGFVESSSDAPAAAGAVSKKFVETMSLKSDGKTRVKYTEGAPKTVKVDGGKTSAVQIRTDVPWSLDENFCEKREREIVVTSVPTDQGTGTVVAARLKGAKGGLDSKTFEKIIDTIRPKASG